MDKQAQADQQHANVDDEKSEFTGYLSCGSGGRRAGRPRTDHKLSNRQYETS